MSGGNTDNNKKRRRGRKGEPENIPAGGNGVQAHKAPLIQFDEEVPTWFLYGQDLPGRNDTVVSDPPKPADQSNSSQLVQKYRAMGDAIFQREIALVGSGKSSDEKWVEKTIKRGTLKDRIAAMSVSVSSDPIHKFYTLDGLLTMAGCSETGGKTNARVAQLTAEALEDLFLNSFLPPDRKLCTLAQRPLYRYESNKNGKQPKKTLSPRILLLWRFEELVHEKYDRFLRTCIRDTLHDGTEMLKIATLKTAANLLTSAPEAESLLLTMMVNKLGDPGKKTAAAAAHQLRMVLQEHPNMQLVIAREVQQLAHRPHLSPRALYGCICFLNQLKLSTDDGNRDETHVLLQRESLPVSLVKTYFRLFDVAVKKDGKKEDPESEEAGMKSRLLSALLTGVNRAHPYLPEKHQEMEEHIDALYRVVHTAAPSACTQALMLLFHLAVGSQIEKEQESADFIASTSQSPSRRDRFYRALYATVSKPSMVSQGKHLTMYFNLLYKAMKYDTDSNRINALGKRLLCTVMHGGPTPIAGSIFLLNEIAKHHSGLRTCLEEAPTPDTASLHFDDTKRDPRVALLIEGAERFEHTDALCPPSWELSMVVHHFHPSVAKFASELGELKYEGDPLKDFGLAPFLDKFAYRNPKSADKLQGHYKRGQSIAERKSGTEGMMKARLELPVNDPAFLEQESVNEQDEFFRKFFVERARRDEIKGIHRARKDLDEDELEDAVDDALDAAEEADGWDTAKTFEEYARNWESDSEEEAFADTLAEKLMEDAADGPVVMDDEDPDMDDWGDMYSDNDEEKGNDSPEIDDDAEDVDGDNSDEEGDVADAGEVHDEDDFMDDVNDDDSEEPEEDDSSDDEGQNAPEDSIVAGIMENMEGEGDDDDEDDDEEDDEDDLALLVGDSDEEEEEEEISRPSRKRAKVELPVFADAEEYMERINQSFEELVGSKKSPKSNDEEPKSSKKKKRKKGKK
eukprot:Nitzschia sp. Nitz4//scaffold17_size182527//112277//115323//NITZ4_001865-RA/size182527-snap-gene-0.299-mRNA-1//-1//CDS//3329539373//3498//frame0